MASTQVVAVGRLERELLAVERMLLRQHLLEDLRRLERHKPKAARLAISSHRDRVRHGPELREVGCELGVADIGKPAHEDLVLGGDGVASSWSPSHGHAALASARLGVPRRTSLRGS